MKHPASRHNLCLTDKSSLLVKPEQFLCPPSRLTEMSLLMNCYTLVASLALTINSQYTSRPCLIMNKVSFGDCICIYIINHENKHAALHSKSLWLRGVNKGTEISNVHMENVCTSFKISTMNVHQQKPTQLEHHV